MDLGREGARTFLNGFATSAYVNSFGHGLVDPALAPRDKPPPASSRRFSDVSYSVARAR